MLGESDDDYEARRALDHERISRWVAEHRALMPSLWFVLRHSGRDGDVWRVIYESRSEKEATDFYYRKLPRNPNGAVCCTVLTHGGTNLWTHHVTKDGLGPRHEGIGLDGTTKAAHAREEREARRARRGQKRQRIAEPPRVVPNGVLTYEVFRQQHPAVRVEADYYTHPMLPGEAMPKARHATRRAYEVYLVQVRVEAPPQRVPPVGLRIAPVTVVESETAEDEAAAVAEARRA